jgi:hypothetical protein
MEFRVISYAKENISGTGLYPSSVTCLFVYNREYIVLLTPAFRTNSHFVLGVCMNLAFVAECGL